MNLKENRVQAVCHAVISTTAVAMDQEMFLPAKTDKADGLPYDSCCVILLKADGTEIERIS